MITTISHVIAFLFLSPPPLLIIIIIESGAFDHAITFLLVPHSTTQLIVLVMACSGYAPVLITIKLISLVWLNERRETSHNKTNAYLWDEQTRSKGKA